MPLSRKKHKKQGFALVIALSLMAFVLLLLLSITTLVQIESKGAQSEVQRMKAEQVALLSLNIAIGKLQETAGLDQRVTAPAEILNDSANMYTGGTIPLEGQSQWTGVWKSDTVSTGTPNYSPADPDRRAFVGWLVSHTNTNGELELPTSLDAIETAPIDSVTLFTDSSGDAYATVGKVNIDSSNHSQQAYAFMVEDESVKADLSWNETPSSETTAERYQAGRLTAAPGPDYGALKGQGATGPFDVLDANSYPLSSDSTTLLSEGIMKLSDLAGITSTMGDAEDASDWLKDQRGNVTWGSRGVLADVKLGGLRRDLSLAFEMDGAEEAETATLFNQQDGEFVSLNISQDKLTPPGKSIGMGQYERFLYRDTPLSGNAFSASITNASSVLRGPNWWALRDYANLYKHLKGTAGDYTLEARPYFPNRATEGKSYDSRFRASGADQWDQERSGGNYIYRPARPAYAPVMLGTLTFVSLGVKEGNYALVIDTLYYLWNPYNRKIKFESLAIASDALDGDYLLEVTDQNTNVTTKYYGNIRQAIEQQFPGNTSPFVCLLEPSAGEGDITMKPGEVMVFTAGVGETHEAKPGYFDDGNGAQNFDTSGVFVTSLSQGGTTSYGTVSAANTTYEFGYYKSVSGANNNVIYSWRTAIPSPGTTSAQIASSWNTVCNDVQYYKTQSAGSGSNNEELVSSGVNITATADNTSQIEGVPQVPPPAKDPPVGMFFTLMKPSNFTGDSYTTDKRNPAEIFARFNPAPMSAYRDHFRECLLNQNFGIVKDEANELLNTYGISFSGSGRAAYWGTSFDGNENGLSHVPMSNIPNTPMFSLAQFSHAHLSFHYSDPFHAVGNSWSHPFIPTETVFYGTVKNPDAGITNRFTADHSWLLNDALFDRYYLSGIAPDYTITSSGYSMSGASVKDEIETTLNTFFTSKYLTAQANPVLRPYLPPIVSASDAVAQLSAPDGYKKMGAYSMINGQFNVNSTSVEVWEALLNANRSLPILDAQGGDNTGTGSPFPASPSPADPDLSDTHWSGFSRLTTSEVRDLAERIVEQVKLRGPFMSLSHFINRRVDSLAAVAVPETCSSGALQAAIENTSPNINQDVRNTAGGAVPDYVSANRLLYYNGSVTAGDRRTTTGIAGDITQADLLLSLAPRLSARSDTFRIRSYGEVKSSDGTLSQAICEAVVQRLPEYVDPTTDATNNEPWDEAMNPFALIDPSNPSANALNAINQRFGRRYEVVQFRWLSASDI